MRRISKKADDVLMAMKHLAGEARDGTATAREIAERCDVPLELLAKVLQHLAREGFLASQCNVRDPLWRVKDRIVATLRTFSLSDMARDAMVGCR